jgi:acetyl esterase
MIIDPGSQRVLDLIRESGRPPFETLPPQEVRALYLRSSEILQAERPAIAATLDVAAPGPDGPLPMRMYRGSGTQSERMLPALVYFHGGGWTIGNLETHDYICRHIANVARCAVFAVDYRLAPEHKFPTAVDDCAAATSWVVAQAGSLGLDSRKIAVGGDSAGGNLAAVLAHMARDGDLPQLCFQLLFYPSVDQGLSQRSYRRVTSGVPLTTGTVRYFRSHYLRDEADQADWRASPLRARSFAGLPPALVVTAAHDPLCDEGQEYARKLEQSGVRVTSLHYSDQVHGFIGWSKFVPAAGATLDLSAAMLANAFAAT